MIHLLLSSITLAWVWLLILEGSRSHTTTHHIRYDSSGRVASWSQRPLPDNTMLLTTNVHAPGGIRTHDPSRREATDLGIRPRDHWGRLFHPIKIFITCFYVLILSCIPVMQHDKTLSFLSIYTVRQLYNETDFILTKIEVLSMKQCMPSM